MRDAVALWQAGGANAAGIIHAACDLLVAGVDGPAVGMLAAVSIKSVRVDSYEIEELLESVMSELDLPYHPRETAAAQESALRIMATRTLEGLMSPRDLTTWAHMTFGHEGIELAQELVALDDYYHFRVEYTGTSAESSKSRCSPKPDASRLFVDEIPRLHGGGQRERAAA